MVQALKTLSLPGISMTSMCYIYPHYINVTIDFGSSTDEKAQEVQSTLDKFVSIEAIPSAVYQQANCMLAI